MHVCTLAHGHLTERATPVQIQQPTKQQQLSPPATVSEAIDQPPLVPQRAGLKGHLPEEQPKHYEHQLASRTEGFAEEAAHPDLRVRGRASPGMPSTLNLTAKASILQAPAYIPN